MFRRNREARYGACGGEIGSLTRPALNTEEMEDGEAEGGAGPSWVGRFDAFEADEAGESAGGGGGEEGLDLGEVGGGGIGWGVAGEVEVGFEY